MVTEEASYTQRGYPGSCRFVTPLWLLERRRSTYDGSVDIDSMDLHSSLSELPMT